MQRDNLKETVQEGDIVTFRCGGKVEIKNIKFLPPHATTYNVVLTFTNLSIHSEYWCYDKQGSHGKACTRAGVFDIMKVERETNLTTVFSAE